VEIRYGKMIQESKKEVLKVVKKKLLVMGVVVLLACLVAVARVSRSTCSGSVSGRR